MNPEKNIKGQAAVEFALVLPFLLLLIIGMAEIGYVFYDYIVLAASNREGVRLGSRGQFDELSVIERIVATGGVQTVEDVTEPVLRTSGPDPNFGTIITTIAISPTGGLSIGAPVITGVIATADEGLRPLTPEDTRINPAEYTTEEDITFQINTLRATEDFEALRNDIVIVETFYAHDVLFSPMAQLVNLCDPFSLYFKSSMRVLRANRLD